jgi:hypothetical protein
MVSVARNFYVGSESRGVRRRLAGNAPRMVSAARNFCVGCELLHAGPRLAGNAGRAVVAVRRRYFYFWVMAEAMTQRAGGGPEDPARCFELHRAGRRLAGDAPRVVSASRDVYVGSESRGVRQRLAGNAPRRVVAARRRYFYFWVMAEAMAHKPGRAQCAMSAARRTP